MIIVTTFLVILSASIVVCCNLNPQMIIVTGGFSTQGGSLNTTEVDYQLSFFIQEYFFLFCSLHENRAKCKSIGHIFGINDFRAAFYSGAQPLRC